MDTLTLCPPCSEPEKEFEVQTLNKLCPCPEIPEKTTDHLLDKILVQQVEINTFADALKDITANKFCF